MGPPIQDVLLRNRFEGQWNELIHPIKLHWVYTGVLLVSIPI